MRAAKERAKMVEQVVQMEKKMQGEDKLRILCGSLVLRLHSNKRENGTCVRYI